MKTYLFLRHNKNWNSIEYFVLLQKKFFSRYNRNGKYYWLFCGIGKKFFYTMYNIILKKYWVFCVIKDISLSFKVYYKTEILLAILFYWNNMLVISNFNKNGKCYRIFFVIKKIYFIFQCVIKNWNIIDYFLLFMKKADMLFSWYNIKVKYYWVFGVMKKIYFIFQLVISKWNIIDYIVLLKKKNIYIYIFLRYNIKIKYYWVFCVIKKKYLSLQSVIKKWNIVDYFVL